MELATEEVQKRVCEKFNTNLAQVKQDVELLKQWIKSQPHLPQCSSDTMLTAFLISSKNSMQRAKEKIDNYYSARGDIPEFFANRDPLDPLIQEAGAEILLSVLPKLTPEGYRVTVFSFATGDPKKYNLPAASRLWLAFEDLKMNQEAFNSGMYFVVDGKHYSMAHIMSMTPTLARNLVHCTQDVLPFIIKGIIFFNAPSYFDLFLSIVKPFMKSKLFQKIHVTSEGPEALEKFFPKAMLPRDYGGEEKSCEELSNFWLKRFEAQRDWFLHEGIEICDESKRIIPRNKSGKNINSEELQGSFKTLCID